MRTPDEKCAQIINDREEEIEEKCIKKEASELRKGEDKQENSRKEKRKLDEEIGRNGS